jgi:hypothetical protein
MKENNRCIKCDKNRSLYDKVCSKQNNEVGQFIE